MGLDNYAPSGENEELPGENGQAFILSVFMLGGSEGGFRGKIYEENIIAITTESLNQDLRKDLIGVPSLSRK